MKLKISFWTAASVLFLSFGVAQASPPPRLGPPQCTRQTVKSGDTVSRIAQQAHVPMAQIVVLNPYIPNLNQIWPLDEITLWCPPEAATPVVVAAVAPPTTAAPSPTTAPAMAAPTTTKVVPPVEAATKPAVVLQLVCNETGGKRPDGSNHCITPLPIIGQYLHAVGFDGEPLVTMLAVTLGESAGDPYAHGDRHITDDKWGDSVGWFQVRTVRAQKGTGGPRDEDALIDPMAQAQAAWRISDGGTNFKAWGAWTNGSYRKFIDQAREAA